MEEISSIAFFIPKIRCVGREKPPSLPLASAEKRIFAFIFHEYAENSGKIFAFFSCIQSNGGCDDPVRIDLSSRQLQCFKHVSQTQKRTGNQFPDFFFVPRIIPLLLLQSCRQIRSRFCSHRGFSRFFCAHEEAIAARIWPSDTTSTTWTLPGSMEGFSKLRDKKR